MKTISKVAIAGLITALGTTTAIADGVVTVYTAAPQNLVDELVPAYEEATGTKVEIIKAGSGELLNRLKAESDDPVADVIWSVDGTVVDFNPDFFAPYTSTHSDKLVPEMKVSENWSPFTAVVMVLAVNKEGLGDLPVPTSWEELATPEYDDLISSARADKSGSAYIQYATVLQAFDDEAKGMEVYRGLMTNFVLSESSGAVPRFVNDGELPVGVTLEDGALRYVEGGGPVEIIYPSEGTAIAPDAMALVKDGPNPDNGKEFIDFMLTKDAQTIVAELGRRPVRTDVDSNDALMPLDEVPTVGYDFDWAAKERERLLEEWNNAVLDLQ